MQKNFSTARVSNKGPSSLSQVRDLATDRAAFGRCNERNPSMKNSKSNLPLYGQRVTADDVKAAVAIVADSALAMHAKPKAVVDPALFVSRDEVAYGRVGERPFKWCEVSMPAHYTSGDVLHFWSNRTFVETLCKLVALMSVAEDGMDEQLDRDISGCRFILQMIMLNG